MKGSIALILVVGGWLASPVHAQTPPARRVSLQVQDLWALNPWECNLPEVPPAVVTRWIPNRVARVVWCLDVSPVEAQARGFYGYVNGLGHGLAPVCLYTIDLQGNQPLNRAYCHSDLPIGAYQKLRAPVGQAGSHSLTVSSYDPLTKIETPQSAPVYLVVATCPTVILTTTPPTLLPTEVPFGTAIEARLAAPMTRLNMVQGIGLAREVGYRVEVDREDFATPTGNTGWLHVFGWCVGIPQ